MFTSPFQAKHQGNSVNRIRNLKYIKQCELEAAKSITTIFVELEPDELNTAIYEPYHLLYKFNH